MSSQNQFVPAPSSVVFRRKGNRLTENFGQHRNEWVRDHRITGNALCIYLYIESHAPGFVVTREMVMRELKLGKEAFNNACKKLQNAGYLNMSSQTQGPDGRWGTIDYEVLDPFLYAPLDAPAPVNPQPWRETRHGEKGPVDNSQNQPWRETRHGEEEPVDNSLVAVEVEAQNPRKQAYVADQVQALVADRDAGTNRGGFPVAGNPPLRENKLKENQSSSVLKTELRADVENDDAAATPPDDDFEIEIFDGGPSEVVADPANPAGAELDRALSVVDDRLCLVKLTELIAAPVLGTLDIVRACTEVLGRAKGYVNNPTAYVADAIKKAPTEFFKGDSQALPTHGEQAPKPWLWVCDRDGHKTDHGSDAQTCFFCGIWGPVEDWDCDIHGHYRHLTSDTSCRGCSHHMTTDSFQILSVSSF